MRQPPIERGPKQPPLRAATAGHKQPPTAALRAPLANKAIPRSLPRIAGARTLDDVLTSSVFTRLVSASWARGSVSEGKLRTCADVCGTGHKGFDRQFDQVERLQQGQLRQEAGEANSGRSRGGGTMMASAPMRKAGVVGAVAARGVERLSRRRRV